MLTVGLPGERPTGWDKTFDTTAKLLGGGDWGDVELKKGKVRVSGVTPGAEERLRHFLESVVQQADATHRPEDESDDSSDDRADPDDQDSGPQDDSDAEATARFQAFGKN
ncbi:MAG TPA: hypothetical protein VGH45_04675 [Solirubrobacteraceae bacterium]